ncbi:hypothetical protein [Alkalihalobacillus sp. AL-G]|uniref:hypothetical protein n=1 Tax=Alkalihalobacillus sp. AL-G TaxID=2926399 RepID=UPI00272B30BE|nr:hypothetical protein [Alkalihalobacillus sp. AL-G]WLD93675.1 hypothetical protein MOJ78_01765 [Alkalihalobacillus sp. AL-G]
MNSTFDWNEWFFILSSLVCLLIFVMLPKRFNSLVTFSLWIFVIVFIETIDYFMAVKPYDLYDFLDGPGYQPTLAVAHIAIFPPCAYFLIYFYDKWKLHGFKLALYILGWTIISITYEWICVLNNVLTYKNWTLLFSIPTYPVACLIVITVFHFIKRNINQ